MRISLINVVALLGLLFPQMLLADGEAAELVFNNNIGLMKDVSSELRQELPMCDEFLDVRWIQEMPDGYWVGRVVVDVKTGDKTEQRELAVLEEKRKRRHGRFNLIDITATKYRGNKFDELILSADSASSYFALESDIIEIGLAVSKGKKTIVVSKERIGSQSYLERGISSIFTQQSNRIICITHPDKKKWLFKKK
ncbi:hypothetical protein [Desulfopila sp. IMCC35008]|uniref:hypothetical protein n=1 Tax=Desulfopila sp. IMCC35008 TaxID=2653858 RepID=UPI0013D73715|nr:hypothetical protein [Desulfopila sp. IMCC35008]